MPDALYIMRASRALEMTPEQFLDSDPALITELLEVVRCENVVQLQEQDATKLTKSDYDLLDDMGLNDHTNESDEEWLLG